MEQNSPTSKLHLERDELDRLINDPSASNRRETAHHVSSLVADHPLTPAEIKIALDLIDSLVTDVEVSVREALADQLKHCTFLPSDIAASLAMDVESVALPILHFSTVLNDEQLILVINQGNAAKQIAIAKRSTVTISISNALIDCGNSEAVTHLLANSGAEIDEPSLHRILDIFIDDPRVISNLTLRELPKTVETRVASVDLAGNVADIVVEGLVEYLVTEHGIPRDMAREIGSTGSERALSDLISRESNVIKQESLAERLYETNRLTPILLLRNLCFGNIQFFESGLALLCQMPQAEIRWLLYSGRANDFLEVFEKSGMPKGLRNAFRIATKIAASERLSGSIGDRDRFTRKVMGQIIRGYRTISPGDTEHILAELSKERLDQLEDLAMAQI